MTSGCTAGDGAHIPTLLGMNPLTHATATRQVIVNSTNYFNRPFLPAQKIPSFPLEFPRCHYTDMEQQRSLSSLVQLCNGPFRNKLGANWFLSFFFDAACMVNLEDRWLPNVSENVSQVLLYGMIGF